MRLSLTPVLRYFFQGWRVKGLLFILMMAALPWAASAQSAATAQPMQMPAQDTEVEEPDAPDDSVQESPPLAVMKAAPKPVRPDKAAPKGKTETLEGGYNVATLRILNKVTARSEEAQAPIGSVVRSGTIEIIAHTCWQSPPDAPPENAALLEVSEIKQGEAPRRIFLGWMYSSSPALSALEHPFYDVTMVKCAKVKE